MFDRYTYLGYTLLFCLPPIALLWGKYARAMRDDLWRILSATAILTLYGNAVWPTAMGWNCWQYSESRILNWKLLGLYHIEDVVWWLLVSLLVASFISLSTRCERQGQDVVLRELRATYRWFRTRASNAASTLLLTVRRSIASRRAVSS